MSNSVEHYTLISRKGRTLDQKVLSVLNEYANPVGALNPAACIYAKSRTFSLIVNEAINLYETSGIQGVIGRLNRYFSDEAIRDQIKPEGDFRHAVRALAQTITGLNVDFFGFDEFITLPTQELTRDRGLRRVESHHERTVVEARVFSKLFDGLIDSVSLPSVDLSAIEDIQQQCIANGIGFDELIKHHDKKTGETVLHALIQPLTDDAYKTSLEKIEEFIVLGADVNARDSEGQTPLLKASILGIGPIVSELTEKHGAKTDIAGGRKGSFGFLPHDFIEFSEGGVTALDLIDESERSVGRTTPVSFGGSACFDDENPSWALDVFASAHQRSRSRSATPTSFSFG